MSRPAFLRIDLDALVHNVQRVCVFAPGRKVIAMVKANAYGHGLVRVAKALNMADAFGVASLEEGVALREAGVKQPVVLMEGLFYGSELAEAAQHDFTLVVHHLPQLEMLEATQVKHEFPIWLKINTGMNRLGIPIEQVDLFHQRLMACAAVKKPIGLMTHFAEADAIGCTATDAQITAFNQATGILVGPKSLANSAGIIAKPDSLQDWVRPGLMMYGASPFADKTGLDYDLQPVMTLYSKLIAIVPVKKGGRVGYGGTWTAPEDMLIGVVGAGYGDGYPQSAQNGTPVLVNGKICPLVGRVSMDMLTVDLRQQADAAIGDPVILWGAGLPIEKVAVKCQSTAYELMTRITARPKVEIKAQGQTQLLWAAQPL